MTYRRRLQKKQDINWCCVTIAHCGLVTSAAVCMSIENPLTLEGDTFAPAGSGSRLCIYTVIFGWWARRFECIGLRYA